MITGSDCHELYDLAAKNVLPLQEWQMMLLDWMQLFSVQFYSAKLRPGTTPTSQRLTKTSRARTLLLTS